MSRIGKMPIDIPADVKVEIKGQDISVTGKKGSLNRSVHPEIGIKVEDNQILVSGGENDKKVNAFRGLTRSLINNMVYVAEKVSLFSLERETLNFEL